MSQSTVVRANILVHSKMADSYNQNEPHFRPENQAKVRKNLEAIAAKRRGRLLDMGCGTGFLINLAKDLFPQIDGIDVTQAMLDRVDRSGGNITLHNVEVESLPFPDGTFDVVTGYAFLHHLQDYALALRQAYRVLKPGGIAYFDLEPNRLYWDTIRAVDSRKFGALPPIIVREIDSVLHTDDRVNEEFGIDQDTFNQAEYTKSIAGGIAPHEFEKIARDLDFSSCVTTYEWYMGQASVMHGQSFEASAVVENYLRSVLPVTGGLFKYLKFELTK